MQYLLRLYSFDCLVLFSHLFATNYSKLYPRLSHLPNTRFVILIQSMGCLQYPSYFLAPLVRLSNCPASFARKVFENPIRIFTLAFISQMARSKTYQLDVDFIGSQEPLTVEEQNAISEYIAAQKKLKASSKSPKKKSKKAEV